MKIITLIRLALCALLITATAHAAPAGKRFGGFAAKQTFTLTIEDRQSFETQGSETVASFRIPAGIPRFNVGQTVKFTIGRKGELKGPGFSLPLDQDNSDYNQYSSASTAKNPAQNTALLTKTSAGTTQQIVIYFRDD
ncbi:hypothetical protein, partial [Luteolibacter yonseiensis]